jgi:3'(2'), 5'-bisphosphate nucleotidase
VIREASAPASAVSARAVERDIAIAAVCDAARLSRSVRAAFQSQFAITKHDRSPVTVADLGAQAIIRLALASALPDDPVMGEEDSQPLHDPQLAAEVADQVAAISPGVSAREIADALDACADSGGPGRRWWTVDPIDGTLGYLRGEQYAIALALVEDGEVMLGVLGCPNLTTEDGIGCLFVAEAAGGAWQLPLDGHGPAQPIKVSDLTDARDARMAESVEPSHSAHDVTRGVAEALGLTAPPIRIDSQAKYALVARGDASIYLRASHGGYRENVWDHAAGALLVAQAGGVVTDLDGRSLDFTVGRRLERNQGIVATPAPIHQEVVAAVRGVLGSPS